MNSKARQPVLSEVLTSYAVFPNARDLVQCLYHCNVSTPPEVIQTGDNSLAVRRDSLPEDAVFETLRGQHGWSVKIKRGAPAGKSLPLAEAVSSMWVYRDPSTLRAPNERRASAQHAGAVTHYDPRNQRLRYLLAARDGRHAQRILDALVAVATNHIESVPFPLQGAHTELPFPYFWMITAGLPPLRILDMAARVWWGPVSDGLPEIYQEYPYHLPIGEAVLRFLNAGDDAEIVLLSRDAPHRLSVRRMDGSPVFQPLTELPSVKVWAQEAVRMLPAAASAAQKFNVQLKLVKHDPREAMKNRVKDLRRQIRSKEREIEVMNKRLRPTGRTELSPEPLLLYGEAPGVIPTELRRLFIEWSDQETELGEVRYQKVESASWPEQIFSPAQEVHVVTTAAALGASASDAVGLQLREYRRHDNKAFELRTEWARHNLRLFTPRFKWPNFYPAFRPGPVATRKLAEALLPAQAQDMREWLVLLVPSRDGRITPCCLKMSHFKPLHNAFRWDCDLTTEEGRAVARAEGRATQQLMCAVENGFTHAVETEAHERLGRREAQAKAVLARLGLETRQHLNRVGQREEEVKRADTLVSNVEELATALKHEARGMMPDLDEIRDYLDAALALMAACDQIATSLRIREARVSTAEWALRELRRRIRELREGR